MMGGRRALVRMVLAALLLAGPAGAAEDVRVSGIAFAVPDGWVAREGAGVGSWQGERRFGGGEGGGMIQVSRPISAVEGSFDAVFERLAGSIPDLKEERPMARGNGRTAAGDRIRFEVRCCVRRNGVSIGTQTVGVSDGRRHAILVLVEAGLRGERARAVRADFDALVRSFRLDAGASPAIMAPPAGAGGLSGTFTLLRTGLMPNAFGGVDFQADNLVRVFDPSGFFSDAVPAADEDVPAHCLAVPDDCGTYRIAAGTRIELRSMTRRFGLIETTEVAFSRNGDKLVVDGEAWRPVPPLPRGKRFDGTWRFFYAASGAGPTTSGSVSSERLLTMSPDGRFRRTGFTGASSSSEIGGGRTGFTTGRERPATEGRYVVNGFRLLLEGDNGQTESLSIVLPDPEGDRLLVINGRNYLKRDGTR